MVPAGMLPSFFSPALRTDLPAGEIGAWRGWHLTLSQQQTSIIKWLFCAINASALQLPFRWTVR